MNIFLLDYDVQKCAQCHCDKHVVKMVLEILCTVSAKFGMNAPYVATHHKHPCVLWAEQSIHNWRWLKKLTIALNEEYKYRYFAEKNHKSFEIAMELLEPDLPCKGLTQHCQVMPDDFRIPGDPVRAYRKYYIESKKSIATWTRRGIPKWYFVKDIEL